METKNDIRYQKRMERDCLSMDERIRKNEDMAIHLFAMPEWKSAKRILCYLSCQSEADTDRIIIEALKKSKEVYVPKVLSDGDECSMEFYKIASILQTQKGYHGIREPKDDCMENPFTKVPLSPSFETLMILPGIAFDKKGARIGYGKGFYDRYLGKKNRIFKAALSYECQLVDAIPTDCGDVYVDAVITEKGIYRTEGKGVNQINMNEMGKRAIKAKYQISKLTTEQKNDALCRIADHLMEDCNLIIQANLIDLENAKTGNMSQAMLDRLALSKERIRLISDGIRQVTKLEDPVMEVLDKTTLPNGLIITKHRVPLGVIGIIYESRPNVTADAFSLCFKAGNAVILKGGSDAIHSNIAIAECIRRTLKSCKINEDAIQMIQSTDRSVTEELMKCREYIDVLIPRGGAGLIKSVVENSKIPVIETGTGNCHIYVDEFASLEKAIPIIVNAKTQRTGVCNACESLVIHESCLKEMLPAIARALHEKNVQMRGDEMACKSINASGGDKENLCICANEEDFQKEYLDLIISIKTVKSLEEAIHHINRCSTGHSEAIITENQVHAERFLKEIDSACVYVNASTRFTDGFEFGMGAEIGISTQKLHARGPMGLKELTSYKYTIMGNGQIRE